MALVPSTFTKSTFDAGPDQEDWTEGVGTVSVETGFYKNPTRPDEEIMIQRKKVVTNQRGSVIRIDEENWTYDVPGGPPLRYDHEIQARVYLPGLGRALRKVQEEIHYFWPFSPLADGDNLGRTRVVNAYVVYDIPEDPSKAATAEGRAKAEEAGMKPGSKRDRIIASGKLWSDANMDNAVVQETGYAQATKWIEGVIFEHDMVEEEFDKWTTWKIKKNALRSGGVEWEGPEYIRKESYSYKLPVPLQPPKISGLPRATGITVEIIGGGAEINNTYFGPSGKFKVAPEQYHVYRKVVSEADRDADGNVERWYRIGPGAPQSTALVGNTAVVDSNGDPASTTPAAESWTEPHDPDPEPQPPDAVFRRIATVVNVNDKNDEGKASYHDTDVEDSATYEYYATAVYGSEESTDSNHEALTFSGSGGIRKHRIVNGEETVDAIAVDDGAFPNEEFGEVLEFDFPFSGEDPVPVATEIANRQFAMNRQTDVQLRVKVAHPLLGIEWGQAVKLPTISWETFANGLHISSATNQVTLMVTGFRRSMSRDNDGGWSSPGTELILSERPKPQ